jgi:glutathionylspermidine synthase
MSGVLANEVAGSRARPDAAVMPESSRETMHAGTSLDAGTFSQVRRRAVLEGCKWDPQVGDVSTLAPFPLFLQAETWETFKRWTEQLTAETLAAEQEILGRPHLMDRLGLPGPIRRLLKHANELPLTPAAARVMRFDFHHTTEGWRISEVNSDVPGGFTEASTFTRLMAEHFLETRMAGSPIDDWSRAIAEAAGGSGTVALLSAPGFMEDHQIIAYMAAHLRALGCRTWLANPRQIEWRDGRARAACDYYAGPVDAIVRFYQSEWFACLPWRCNWRPFFIGGHTPVANPGIAALSESKRLALLWNDLRTPMDRWRALLPETRDPREVNWENDDGWLCKSAFCNNGETVSIRSQLDAKKRSALKRAIRRHPGQWLAQRRFETRPLETPLGPMYPCIGVYTVNGKAAGVYARITGKPLVDYTAMDAALLVTDESMAER